MKYNRTNALSHLSYMCMYYMHIYVCSSMQYDIYSSHSIILLVVCELTFRLFCVSFPPGFMDSVRYMLGSSGGSWATVVYSYFQHEDISDSVMLGPVVFPEHITLNGLQEMAPGCVRAYTNTTYQMMGVLFSDWMDAVQVRYIYTHTHLYIYIYIYIHYAFIEACDIHLYMYLYVPLTY